MIWKMIGMAAATLTMFSFIPQIVKAVKTRSVRDVSLLTLFQFFAGVSLWIAYGIHLKDKIIIVANLVTLTNVIVLIALYFYFERRKAL